MVLGTAIGGLMSEIRAHPWTTLSALLALAGVITMSPAYLAAGEIVERVANVEKQLQAQFRETLENRLNILKSARFDVEAKIEDIKLENRQVEVIYYAELKRLNAEIDHVERELGDL